MSIIYVFSAPAVMKRAYHAFRLTHLLNILLYAFTILHGLPKLLDVVFYIFIIYYIFSLQNSGILYLVQLLFSLLVRVKCINK